MEAKPQGSFGVPAHIKKHIEDTQARKEAAASAPAPAKGEAAPPKMGEDQTAVDEKNADEKEREEFLKLKANYEKRLGVAITEDVVTEYLFRGRMTINNVTIIPGKATGTFRTLLTEDHDSIAERVALFRVAYTKDNGTAPDATVVANEHAKWTLAYTWLSFENEARKMGGRFPEKVEDRYKEIKTISTHLMEKAIETWNNLELLIRFSLEEERFVKKS
jgi:hypothetical protein